MPKYWRDATESELIQAACSGQDGAFAEILSRVDPVIKTTVNFILNNKCGHHDDVVQDARLRVHLRLPQFLQQGDSFIGWVRVLTRHVSLNHCRQCWRDHWNQLSDADHAVSIDAAESLLMWDGIESFLLTLDERDRSIVEHVYIEGTSHEAVANLFGMTPVNVRVRLHRIRARLRAWLKESGVK